MTVSILNFTTRGEILKPLVGNDYGMVGKYMATWTGATALVEFLLNPVVGKLSDTYGRKPFMLLAPYAAIIFKVWVLLRPSIFSLTVERIVCDCLRTLSGTTMGSAALLDLVPQDKIAMAMADLWKFMGAAIIISPLIASRLTARGTYKAAIAIAAVQLVTDQFFLQETLADSKKKPFTGVPSPFSVYRLFTGSKLLATASSLMAFQFLMDPKIMADPWITLQLDYLKWTRPQTQMYTALIGLGMFAGSKVTKASMKKWGEHGHTTFANLATIAENLITGLLPSTAAQFVTIPLQWAGATRMNATKQMVARVALASGDIGKGELSGLQGNLRAMMVTIGPFLYSKAYESGSAVGLPGGSFLLCAAMAAAAEMSHKKIIGKLNETKKNDSA